MEHIHIHSETPQERHIAKARQILVQEEGIAIYPTDTVYGVGCCVENQKKIKEIATILNKDKERKFSFLFHTISQAQQYVDISTPNFKLLKQYTPGPYTFILPASPYVRKKISKKRKYVGIRIPDNPVIQALLEAVGHPMANISLNTSGENRWDPAHFMTPEVLNGVHLMLDAGPCHPTIPSTIIDLTSGTPELLRPGKGAWHG
ncbi:L-threonylcarbamoyladenylate synthase [Chitinivibrio alkaliphilus]|uniref:Translation factor SUA5 n=1 Tax=Chitinivibrio alkaliphilus ACht1 TaxID=1313304 RepID=U7D954_9BACT|nr:L-threonylcarbamoyladenylate synthase [Chitinivibrio alkaliphilus]ERP31627.1 translation factor SUA5 [Chitinivibrio alkaliphilus ACht1]